MTFPGLGGLSPLEVLRRTYRQLEEDHVLTFAAALAYHGLLAIFPFLVFLLALVTFLDEPELFDHALEWASALLPPQTLGPIEEAITGFRESDNTGLLSLGALGAVWAASGGVRAVMTALNRAYDVPQGRRTWKRYLLSLLYTVALGVLVLAAAALMLLGPQAAVWLADRVGLGGWISWAWRWFRYPVAVALLMLTAGVAYSVLPNLSRFRWISPGAVLAVLLWIALSFGFRAYLDNFGRLNVLYGSLGAVIVLLLYLWVSGVVLLIGGEVNGVVDRGMEGRPRASASDR